jgi:hypothetical protein
VRNSPRAGRSNRVRERRPGGSRCAHRRSGLSAPLAFDIRALALVFQPALARAARRRGCDARARPHSRLAQQRKEPFASICAILHLAAKAARFDDEIAVARDVGSRKADEPAMHVCRKLRARQRLAQLHSGGHFVNVLPARTGRAHEMFFDQRLVDEARSLRHPCSVADRQRASAAIARRARPVPHHRGA